ADAPAPSAGPSLLGAPLRAHGLHRISRGCWGGRRPSLWRALTAWRANPYHILTAGLILMLYVMIWARMNVVAFALFFPHEAIALDHFVAQMFSLDGLVFTVFITALGFAFAAFAFITNVTALPMMMDRPVDVFAAALASAMAVLRNPRVMALWAGRIARGTGAGVWTAYVGWEGGRSGDVRGGG
ncbi:DUF2189 domain-containing protein, partial [Azospirillum brasilense]|nr:DUF2189 domain-containing protein [Azospirillum brasilense]